MRSIKVPLHYLLLASVIASTATFLYIKHIKSDDSAASEVTSSIVPAENAATNNSTNATNTPNANTDNADPDYGIKRLGGFKYIAPIIGAGPVKESNKYSALKGDIFDLISKEKKTGLVSSVSVYLKNFQTSNWMAINPDENYSPGSLLKVAVLITYLRMSENVPNLMKKELVFHGNKRFRYPTQHYLSDTVKEGRKYSITDLLRYMIKYSDNKATLFLETYMDTTIFKREFSDLGMRDIHFDDPNYTLSVKEYSRLMKALYNAGYLGAANSEYATSLLTESTFREGLLKELPSSVTVAHKFGEAGDGINHELHESGIIYANGNTYLLTVMTRGTDWDELSHTISHISKLVYDKTVVQADGATTYKVTAER